MSLKFQVELAKRHSLNEPGSKNGKVQLTYEATVKVLTRGGDYRRLYCVGLADEEVYYRFYAAERDPSPGGALSIRDKLQESNYNSFSDLVPQLVEELLFVYCGMEDLEATWGFTLVRRINSTVVTQLQLIQGDLSLEERKELELALNAQIFDIGN